MKNRKNALRAGETLVEVMVSIVVFLLVVAMFQGAVSFCTNAQAKSREIRKNTNAIIESLRNSTGTPTKGSKNTLYFHAKDVASGAMVFSVDVTPDQLDVTYTNTQGNSSKATFYLYGEEPTLPGGGGP